MNNFVKGMGSIGQLFPPTIRPSEYPAQNSAWEGVAKSFSQAGDSLRRAIKECSDVKQANTKKP